MAHGTRNIGKRFRDWLKNSWLLYAFVSLAIRAVGALPLPLARWLGRVAGLLAHTGDFGHRATGLENLALAFPEKTEAERRTILRASYVHMGLCAADFCHFPHIKPEDIRARWVVPEEGADERVRQAFAAERGIIAVAAHIGFWELSGFAFPTLGLPLVSISREIEAPRLEELINRIRSRLGNNVVHKEGALRPVLRALHENKSVGVIMDQYGGPDSPWVPFFSRDASTVDTCARLHIRTGAPLLSNLMIRRPDGRYTWRCRQLPVPPRGNESDDDYVKLILREINRDFENAIREAPEQWLWIYKRWKGRPRNGGTAGRDARATASDENGLQT